MLHIGDIASNVFRKQTVKFLFYFEQLFGLYFNVGSLTLRTAKHLVNHNFTVGQCVTLTFGAAAQQKRAHTCRKPDTNRRNVAANVVHRVVNGKSCRHAAAGAVDVQRNIFGGVFAFKIDKLRNDKVCNVVVDFAAEENYSVLKQARINVKTAFAAVGAVHDHRYKCHFCLLRMRNVPPRLFAVINITSGKCCHIPDVRLAGNCDNTLPFTLPELSFVVG